MSEPLKSIIAAGLAVGVAAAALWSPLAQAQSDRNASQPRIGDFILAVVNQELVTAIELEQRVLRARDSALREGQSLPPDAVLRQQILDNLIDERAQIAYARESGQRVDEAEIDRAVANVAAQNQVSMPQLRQRLAQDGIDYSRFRKNLRDQILLERVREREVQARITITEADIDAFLEKRRAAASSKPEVNLAQILIAVPESAGSAEVAERQARANAALARVTAGEPFDKVALEMSDDPSKARGGVMGLRPSDRWPDVFLDNVRGLTAGQVSTTPLRTGAGFHVLKVVERRNPQAFSLIETRARHILLRTTPQLDQAAAVRKMAGLKAQIVAGTSTFEQMAKDNSEDGSAAQGGDLGWTFPGVFVPEFEDAMTALPVGGISEPVVSRFGVHLIQVVERRQASLDTKQEREQARGLLRESKTAEAYLEWNRELRSRTYVEMREPPR